MERIKNIGLILNKIGLTKIMLILFLTYLFWLIVPSEWNNLFEEVKLPYITSHNIFYFFWFIVSFLIVFLFNYLLNLFNKYHKKKKIKNEKIRIRQEEIEKEKLEKERIRIKKLQFFRNLDPEDKKILFMFIEQRKNKVLINGSRNDSISIRHLTSNYIISDMGTTSNIKNTFRYYLLNEKYRIYVEKIYDEEHKSVSK